MKSIKLSIVALFVASASFAQSKEVKSETAKAVQVAPAEVKAPAAPKQSTIKWDQEMHDNHRFIQVVGAYRISQSLVSL